MKVLVTGHRGYIGVEMVPVLHAAGHEVVGLDTGYYDECDFRAPPDNVPELDIDLRDISPEPLRGFDAVIHLAALSNDPLSDLNPGITYEINQHASVRLARAAKLVEQEVAQLADESFSPMYLRNATAYGVSRRLRADIVVNNLVGHAFTTGKVLLQSDGTPWRPLVHIRDIINAFLAGLTAPLDAIHNQAFNIGRYSDNFRIREVANLVAEVVPNCEVAFAPGASPDTRNYRVDFQKAETRLPGYSPTWTLRMGIEELYKAYKDGDLTKDEFLGPRYYRLRTVKGLQERGVLDANLRRMHA